MRAATYTIPPVAGDTASAECVVYFFGAGQGGSVQANLDHWKGQILAPRGQTIGREDREADDSWTEGDDD